MNTPTPDYGEPWQDNQHWRGSVMTRAHSPVIDNCLLMKRALTCVNALAGVQDPAAHLAGLNATIERYEDTIKTMNDALKEAHRIFGKVQPIRFADYVDFAEVAEKVKHAHDPHA